MRTKVREKRVEMNLTQQDVADYLGRSRGSVSQFELGTRDFPLGDIIKLKNLFKIEEDSFFLDSNDTSRV